MGLKPNGNLSKRKKNNLNQSIKLVPSSSPTLPLSVGPNLPSSSKPIPTQPTPIASSPLSSNPFNALASTEEDLPQNSLFFPLSLSHNILPPFLVLLHHPWNQH